MAKIHPGATLTPHFRDFLPAWLAGRPWYAGTGTPVVRPVGYLRFEDPAGEVGMETHLVDGGGVLYQIPMTYRDAPLSTTDTRGLIATAEHSVLGTRYIYDAETDPLWREQLLRIIDTNGMSEPSGKRGFGPAEARGERRSARPLVSEQVTIELVRIPTPPPDDAEVAGLLMGTWHVDSGVTASGCLAIVRHRPAGPSGVARPNASDRG